CVCGVDVGCHWLRTGAPAPRTFKRRFGGGGRGRLAGGDGAGVPGGPPSVRLPTFGRRQGRRVHADRCPVGGRGGQGEATRGRARRARPGVGHGRVQTLRARRGGLGRPVVGRLRARALPDVRDRRCATG